MQLQVVHNFMHKTKSYDHAHKVLCFGLPFSYILILGTSILTNYFQHCWNFYLHIVYMCYCISLTKLITGESGLVFRGNLAGGKLVAVKTVKGEQ